MVVGTQARILYQDALGRMKIALKFNELVRNGEVGPIMLGRDHHDTGGTDSPLPGGLQHQRRLQCHGGYGRTVLRR